MPDSKSFFPGNRFVDPSKSLKAFSSSTDLISALPIGMGTASSLNQFSKCLRMLTLFSRSCLTLTWQAWKLCDCLGTCGNATNFVPIADGEPRGKPRRLQFVRRECFAKGGAFLFPLANQLYNWGYLALVLSGLSGLYIVCDPYQPRLRAGLAWQTEYFAGVGSS